MDGELVDFRVWITDDNLEVRVDCPVSPASLDVTAARVFHAATALGVSGVPPTEVIQEMLLSAANGADALRDFTLLAGAAPVAPVDGRLEWADDFFVTGFARDEATDRIDFRERIDKRMVEAGQLLVRVIPATPGSSGSDVFGRQAEVPAARAVQFKPGQGVEPGETEYSYVAAIAGHVRFVDEKLSVDAVYTVEGNINLETGNLTHPGSVVVAGDIETGAKVVAAGDIEVRGIVEGAEIVCGGNLLVGGGIVGARGKTLSVSGGIRAKYITDAEIEAGGDVIIEREIIQTHLKTQGAVHVMSGRIIGGEVTALGGIGTGQAGSEAEVPTALVAAVDYRLADAVAREESKIEQMLQKASKVEGEIAPLLARIKILSAAQREAATELSMHVYELRKQAERLREELDGQLSTSRARSKPEVAVSRKAFAATAIGIGQHRLVLQNSVDGPVRYVSHGHSGIECVRRGGSPPAPAASTAQ